MAERVLENLGAIERGWKAIKDTAAEAWEGLKEIGRDATLERRLFVEQEGLDRAKALAKNNPDGQRMVDQQQRVVDLLEKQIKMRDEAQKQAANIRKEQADSVRFAADFDRLRDQTQSKAEKFAREERQWQEKLNALKNTAIKLKFLLLSRLLPACDNSIRKNWRLKRRVRLRNHLGRPGIKIYFRLLLPVCV